MKIAYQFLDCHEVRMGSPFKMCRLALSGEWTPMLNEYGWTPVAVESPDGRYLALVHWDDEGNIPGFRVVLIDIEQRSVSISSRIVRCCCESLTWRNDSIAWKAFPGLEGTLPVPFQEDCAGWKLDPRR
jgi:hypothetical protein